MLLFPSCDIDVCAKVKVFIVDAGFNIIADDQAKEDLAAEKEKETRRKGKTK